MLRPPPTHTSAHVLSCRTGRGALGLELALRSYTVQSVLCSWGRREAGQGLGAHRPV